MLLIFGMKDIFQNFNVEHEQNKEGIGLPDLLR